MKTSWYLDFKAFHFDTYEVSFTLKKPFETYQRGTEKTAFKSCNHICFKFILTIQCHTVRVLIETNLTQWFI